MEVPSTINEGKASEAEFKFTVPLLFVKSSVRVNEPVEFIFRIAPKLIVISSNDTSVVISGSLVTFAITGDLPDTGTMFELQFAGVPQSLLDEPFHVFACS